VRHERGGDIEIEDWDEFADACRDGWISPADAAIAEQTAISLEAALRDRRAPLGDEGWRRLMALQ
jgi:predicted RNA-binding protein associated with RNAse of E/G family